MRSICVFCGSSSGYDRAFEAQAQTCGTALAERGWRMVYGGAETGLMGVAARACLDADGEVLGVIPEFLIPIEGAQAGAEIRITATLAARKATMVEEADGFLILPGGAGTLEEIFDVVMLGQMGRHDKPIAFVDTAFWGPLETLMRHIVATGFTDPSVLERMSFFDEVEDALVALDEAGSEPAS